MVNEKSSFNRKIVDRLEENAQLMTTIARSGTEDIEAIIKAIVFAIRACGKVVLCGNGGSAADAQHIAAELIGRFKLERQAFPAIALTTNSSILTAIGNDYGYDRVFARQVEAIVDEKDIVIGITTSGNSPNVLEALKTAKTKGAKTIAFTGDNASGIAGVADFILNVPSNSTPRIQEAHITIGHIVCELVEQELSKGCFPKEKND
ncbi:MAG: D-sedoheptulose 7-phosphate isomerase [Chloroflexi bacterium]|nr:D-sedoheptulose 7-phosphate isomerase [Chloroflexota bacterium]